MAGTTGADSKRALREKAKKLRELARSAEKAAGGDYDAHREKMAAKSRERAAGGQEIGPLPAVADAARRESCRENLRLFCETYLGEWFPLRWSDDHLAAIDRMQRCVLTGGQFAFAMARGSGKSTLCEAGVLHAACYGHRRFVVLVGSSEDAARESLSTIKLELEQNDLLLDDFPEVCYPLRCLEGNNNRANGQKLGGRRTRISWTEARIALPTVTGSPSSGSRVRVAGITGRIRGMKATADGKSIRPDLAIVDDPSTDESATSPSQNDKREKILCRAVLGMAGPKKKIAAFVPCTVIAPGDLADRVLDRDRHPVWQGQRSRMVLSWPSDELLWERYAELRRRSLREGGEGEPATDFYRANREAMDAGARVSWPERFNDDELSGIQHAMNLKIDRGERAFNAEFQNDPQTDELAGQVESLDPDAVAARVNDVPRGEVPRDCTRLTAFVDCGKHVLHYVVCGWTERFGGAVVDYGTFPRQNRSYYEARDARPSLADAFPGYDDRERLYAGLKATVELVAGRAYPREGVGGEVQVEKCLIDSGWEDKEVHKFCRQNRTRFHNVLLPSIGYGIGAKGNPMSLWQPKNPADRKGHHWFLRASTAAGLGSAVVVDTNYWKSLVAGKLTVPEGNAGALTLFGEGRGEHQLFADHCVAEYRVATEGRGRKLEEWSIRPERRDNHFWDAVVGATCAASLIGVAWDAGAVVGDHASPRGPKARRRLSDEYRRKHGDG